MCCLWKNFIFICIYLRGLKESLNRKLFLKDFCLVKEYLIEIENSSRHMNKYGVATKFSGFENHI